MATKFVHPIGIGLRHARRAAKLSQVQLALAVGLDPATVAALEQGCGTQASLRRVLGHLGLALRSRSLPLGAPGPALAALRRRLGLSRRGLARNLAVSRTTLANLEADGSGRIEGLLAYATALGVKFELIPVDAPRDFFTQVGASSHHHGWTTPVELGQRLNKVFGHFDLDPCAPDRNRASAAVKARVHLTVEDDGLSAVWRGLVYVNPPYGRVLSLWMAKCCRESREGARIIALVPARTDTRWWHDYVADQADTFLIRGRLRFGGQQKDAPFPSALIGWGLTDQDVVRLRTEFPEVAYIPSARQPHGEHGSDREKAEPITRSMGLRSCKN